MITLRPMYGKFPIEATVEVIIDDKPVGKIQVNDQREFEYRSFGSQTYQHWHLLAIHWFILQCEQCFMWQEVTWNTSDYMVKDLQKVVDEESKHYANATVLVEGAKA